MTNFLLLFSYLQPFVELLLLKYFKHGSLSNLFWKTFQFKKIKSSSGGFINITIFNSFNKKISILPPQRVIGNSGGGQNF